MRRLIRPLLLAGLALIFAGLILFSLLAVRYPVSGARENELSVTKLSLTHNVERARDGQLAPAGAAAAQKDKSNKKTKGSEACPSLD